MKVIDLLCTCESNPFVDVVIMGNVYNCFTDEYENDVIASWHHKEHDHWYFGQLDCYSTTDVNELEPYFFHKVKSFDMINTLELDKTPILYITI